MKYKYLIVLNLILNVFFVILSLFISIELLLITINNIFEFDGLNKIESVKFFINLLLIGLMFYLSKDHQNNQLSLKDEIKRLFILFGIVLVKIFLNSF